MPIVPDSIPSDAIWKAFGELPSRRWKKNQMIYLQGEPADTFYYLKHGSVKIFLSSETGTEKTLTILSPGEIFGEAAFLDGLPRMSSARAIENAEIVSIGKRDLMKCFRRQPELAMAMLSYLSRTVRMLSGQLDGMSFLQAPTRIAQILLNLAVGSWTVTCSQEELAALAGVSRITVSRTLADFVQKGWIRTGYRTIWIQDAQALGRYCGTEQS